MSPLLLAFSLALGEPASAVEPGALELRWSAPSSCPDRDALLATVWATLGELDGHELRPVRVNGRLEPVSEGFALRLDLDDGGRTSTRELAGPSCEELTEAAALVIAMTIDPRLLERMQQPPPEQPPPEQPPVGEVPPPHEVPTVEPATPAEPQPAVDPQPAPEPQPAEPGDASPGASPPESRPRFAGLHALARVHAGLGGGPLPGPAGVLSLAVGVGGQRWRTELTATYWAPRTTTSPINPAIGVHAQLWTLGANACIEPAAATLTFPSCVGVLAGAVHAHGTGQLVPATVVSRWVALALEPGLTWWFRPRVGLAVRTRGHVALARPALVSDPSGTVFDGAPVGGALLVGMELRLP